MRPTVGLAGLAALMDAPSRSVSGRSRAVWEMPRAPELFHNPMSVAREFPHRF